jgi:acetylornithine/succinyldiaminopimelate/putrescine aminotransferase
VCAAALEALRIIEDEKLIANARARGEEVRAGLRKLAAKHAFIKEIRGEGLMLGIELTVDGNAFAAEAFRRGLLINCTHDRVLRLLPSYRITSAQVREFLRQFASVLSETKQPAPQVADAAAPPPQSRAAAR